MFWGTMSKYLKKWKLKKIFTTTIEFTSLNRTIFCDIVLYSILI